MIESVVKDNRPFVAFIVVAVLLNILFADLLFGWFDVDLWIAIPMAIICIFVMDWGMRD